MKWSHPLASFSLGVLRIPLKFHVCDHIRYTHKQYHKLPCCSFPLEDVSICQSTRHSYTPDDDESRETTTYLSQCGYKFRDCLIHSNISRSSHLFSVLKSTILWLSVSPSFVLP